MTELQKLRGSEPASVGLALPTTPRMRYWKPAPALRGLVSGYHLYAVTTPPGRPHRDVFQPAWANIRVLLTAATDWRVRVGEGAWKPVGECALFGPSSQVTWSESGSGIVVGAGLTPLGWARLSKFPAASWANRVEDCDAAFGDVIAALRPLLRGAADDDALPVLFDAFLIGAMARATRLDSAIARLDSALLDPANTTVGALAKRIGITPRSLERIAARAFGFPPKLLLRRARFLRSLHAIRRAEPSERAAAIDPGYTDYPHFIRDAQDFLGMPPRAFLKLDMPLFAQSAKLRDQVLGAPAQALGSG
ncbi:AraC family transcriptional regulator [Novosphingobium sp. Gsoil 351]|uniref:helix-turn-helix domain-containing protein n=1 Tax=Novosphingobium sp. Gsoil 351 TaxID=2675225 RepID=UPI0018A8561E|nr:AraC family transcriptional regulator [Novosphingobium sp. Gsoil 351]